MLTVHIVQFSQEEGQSYELEQEINSLIVPLARLREIEDFMRSNAISLGFTSGEQWVAKNITQTGAVYKTSSIIDSKKVKIRLEARIIMTVGITDSLRV